MNKTVMKHRPRAHSAPAITLLATATLKYKNGVCYPYCSECNEPRNFVMVRSGYNPHDHHHHSSRRNSLANSNRLNSNGHCSLDGAGSTLSRLQARRMSVVEKMTQRKESFEAKCCHINVLLVVMQMFLGIIIIALAFYMQTITSSLPVRETPYWAGIPLALAGIVGTFFFCCMDSDAYSGSTRTFLIKGTCFVLSTISVFVSIVASIFPGMHGGRIPSYNCNYTSSKCLCVQTEDGLPKQYVYENITYDNCDIIFSGLKDYLILQCAFNAIGCAVSVWLVVLLWQSRYSKFHSGLKFYSYSASNTDHPWINPARPPYPVVETPSFDRKLSQKKLLVKQESVLAASATSAQPKELEIIEV